MSTIPINTVRKKGSADIISSQQLFLKILAGLLFFALTACYVAPQPNIEQYQPKDNHPWETDQSVSDTTTNISISSAQPAEININFADQVAITHRLGLGFVKDFDISPDGETVALSTSQGVFLYEFTELVQIRKVEQSGVNASIAFSPNGKFLASSVGQNVRMINMDTGEVEFTFEGDSGNISCLRFSPDGVTLIAGTNDGAISFWDTGEAELLFTIDLDGVGIASLVHSADGTLFAAGNNKGDVYVVQASDGKQRYLFKGNVGKVDALGYSPKGEYLAVGSADDSTVRIWSISTGEIVRNLEGHTGGVTTLSYSSNNMILAVGGDDGVIRMWDWERGRIQQKFNWTGEAVHQLKFSPDGSILMAIYSPAAVILWDPANGNILRKIEGHRSYVNDVKYSIDGSFVASASRDTTVILWDMENGGISTILQHDASVRTIDFSPDGEYLAAGLADGTIVFWHIDDWKLAYSRFLGERVWDIAYSPDGRLFAATGVNASSESIIRVWQVSDMTLLYEKGSRRRTYTYCLAFSPDSSELISGGSNGIATVRYAAHGGTLYTNGEIDLDKKIFDLIYSNDGKIIATAVTSTSTNDKRNHIQLWNSSELLVGLTGHNLERRNDYVNALVFSPDDLLLASGADDNRIILWSVMDWEKLASLSGHLNSVTSLDFSPDGKELVSGSLDNTVFVWGIPQSDNAP